MRTERQIAASRANGRKSHGAVTPEGRARIVNANLWTGLFAEDNVLTWEFQEDFDDLKDEYYSCHPPHSPEARYLVDQLITCEWHLRRFANVELSVWEDLANQSDAADTTAAAARTGDHVFHRIQSRINATRRAFHSALKELERLEARDADVVVVPKNSDGIAYGSNQNDLPVLGSLRQTACENLTPVPSGPVADTNSTAASVETPSHPQDQQDDTKPGTEGGGLADVPSLAVGEADSNSACGVGLLACPARAECGGGSAGAGSEDKAPRKPLHGGGRRQAAVQDRERESTAGEGIDVVRQSELDRQNAAWVEALANARKNRVPERDASREVAGDVS